MADSYLIVRKHDATDDASRLQSKLADAISVEDADSVMKILSQQEPDVMFHVYQVDEKTAAQTKVMAYCRTPDVETKLFPGDDTKGGARG